MFECGEYEECDDNNVDYSQMFQQVSRLGTYLVMYNHVFSEFNPIKFAKNGLFYNERYNVIICFSCRKKTPTKFKILLPGTAYKKSNFHFDECKLENNKPLPVPDTDVYEIIQINLHREYCAEKLQLPSIINESSSSDPPTDPQTTSSQKQQKPSSQQLTEYDSVDKRLSTFSKWPSSAPVKPVELAEAGFIYLGTYDVVQCVYCQGKLSHWEPGDDPIREHFRHFHNCYFILEMKMNHKSLSTGTARAVEVSDCGTNRPQGNTNLSSQVNVSDNQGTGDKFNTMSSRLTTLKNWLHPTLTANQLSLAGFYWDETKKVCKCFRCNVRIPNWQTDDDPFKVHALKSPECSYILQVKGKQFVTDTVQKYSMVSRESAQLPDLNEDFLNVEISNNSRETDALKDENEKLKDEKMCIICTTEPKTIVILPCAHLVCCSTCATSLQSCPVCRTRIMGTVKTFLP